MVSLNTTGIENMERSQERPVIISVIIPTYNRKEMVLRLVRSIISKVSFTEGDIEVIIVDDCSSDGTQEVLSELLKKSNISNIKVLRTNTPKLVSYCRNLGAQHASGDILFFIDDDNVLLTDMLGAVGKWLRLHPEIGILGPIMYYYREPQKIWCAGIARSYWTTLTRYLYRGKCDNGQFKEILTTEDVPNAIAVRREVAFKAGLFDCDLFPIHYEEADFAMRVKAMGYRVVINPHFKIWHDVPEKGAILGVTLKNPARAYYDIRNRILFHRRWSRGNLQRCVATFFGIAISLTYIVAAFVSRQSKATICAMIHGLFDGLRMNIDKECKG